MTNYHRSKSSLESNDKAETSKKAEMSSPLFWPYVPKSRLKGEKCFIWSWFSMCWRALENSTFIKVNKPKYLSSSTGNKHKVVFSFPLLSYVNCSISKGFEKMHRAIFLDLFQWGQWKQFMGIIWVMLYRTFPISKVVKKSSIVTSNLSLIDVYRVNNALNLSIPFGASTTFSVF